jgi:hypothetical protein
MNAQEGREQRRGLRENWEPLDAHDGFTLGVEKSNVPANGLVGYFHSK